MDTDDLEPMQKKATARNLDELSIEAIAEYIAELKSEIERAQAVVGEKEAARDGAEAFFKK